MYASELMESGLKLYVLYLNTITIGIQKWESGSYLLNMLN